VGSNPTPSAIFKHKLQSSAMKALELKIAETFLLGADEVIE
jgi:hypothetical protein